MSSTSARSSADTHTSTEEQLITLFSSFGLSESKAKETAKNSVLSKRLERIADEAVRNGFGLQENGKLFYHLASKMKSQHDKRVPLLVRYIGDRKLNTVQRVDAALQFFLSDIRTDDHVDKDALESACGVGVTITTEEIRRCVRETLEKYKEEGMAGGNKYARSGKLIRDVQEKLRWADGKAVVEEVNHVLVAVDDKTDDRERNTAEINNRSTTAELSNHRNHDAEDEEVALSIAEVMKKLNFHKPGENYTSEGYIVTKNTEDLLKAHLAATKGKVRTRFPPEPNGILHIGHAKAININFGYAEVHKGICFLRYDDTNPEKEEEKFYTGIRRAVEWLGYTPYKITHSSDYFDQLYQLAIKLIERGLAYVCHQKQEDIKGFNPPPSPWRGRPVEENLTLFECMKNGMFAEGAATLRMKVQLEEGKQDPVAYRIKYLLHHRTGNKWCVYPTYDYTHCLCDSIENITHSLCTKEFQSRRSAYYWLCNALDVYCPVQWEYGRLNVNYTVVSKRKIARLIDDGIVRDWDDPRLYTLTALKRRGVPPEAINRFCAKLGVTGAQATVDPQLLDSETRHILNDTAPRAMVVTDPLRVNIVNFVALALPDTVEVPDFPSDPSKGGTHTIRLNETIYIERSDFQQFGDRHYRRLTRDQTVGLRYAGIIIRVKVVEYDSRERVMTLLVSGEKVTPTNKPKAFIHWVSGDRAIPVRLNLYDRLFFHKNPEDTEEVKDGYLSDVNPNSLAVLEGVADKSLSSGYPARTRVFQFERTGFFCRDPDSTLMLAVFNRTVTLKEDANK